MNTNTTTSQPLDLEAAFRAQRTAARNALPAMLALLPLDAPPAKEKTAL